MTRERTADPDALEPNVTPFLDVLFVPLILFMIMSTNQQKGLETQLPPIRTRPAADNTPAIVLGSSQTRAEAVVTPYPSPLAFPCVRGVGYTSNRAVPVVRSLARTAHVFPFQPCFVAR